MEPQTQLLGVEKVIRKSLANAIFYANSLADNEVAEFNDSN